MVDEVITPEVKVKRISKIRLLPKVLLKEINEAIDRGAGAMVLQTLIRERYKGDLKVDSYFIISNYIKEYKKEKASGVVVPIETNSVDSTMTQNAVENSVLIQTTPWDWGDKKQILQELGNWCKSQADKLRVETDLSPGQEAALVKYFSEIRGIVETLSKLSGELDTGGDKQIIIGIVQQETFTILNSVHAAIKEVYGDEKLIIFKETLKRKFKELGIQSLNKDNLIEINKAPETSKTLEVKE